MSDIGEIYTDEQIKEIERRIKKVYSRASKEIQKKTDEFISQFERLDKEKRRQVRNGTLSKEDYQKWKENKVFNREVWKSKQKDCTNILTNANKMAMDIANGKTWDVFIENANYTLYDIEKQLGMDLSFSIYNTEAVKRLIVEEPNLLPEPSVNIPKDKAWNMKKIDYQVTQSIIQGESIPELAERLIDVVGHNQGNMLMHARTMMTGAQNAGRLRGMMDAQRKGVNLKKTWMSAHDNHVRELHRALDGESVELEEPFEIGGYEIMYPGDPDAEPSMVYNCRCALSNEVDMDNPINLDKIIYDNYEEDFDLEEWLEMHGG